MAIPALVLAWSIRQAMRPGRQIVFHAIACEDDAIPSDAPGLLNSEFFDFRPVRAPASDLLRVDLSQAIVSSHASLVRLDLPEIIPEPDRILYLDCDTIVRRPLDALFDLDMDGRVISACADYLLLELSAGSGPQSKFARHVASLVSDPSAYFNTGVLLIDCAKWRGSGCSAQLKSLLLSPKTKFLFADQDALNFVFQTDYKRLDPRWNAFAYRPKPIKDEEVAAIAALCEADPWITHFAGGTKPWIKHQTHTPQHDEFWRMAKSSPFYEQMTQLSDAASLGQIPMLRRAASRKVAEFLMTVSRHLYFFEAQVRMQPDVSRSIFNAAENMYQKEIN
jgi:lipopolysaccharide biosynthesis glycosyltransferase